MYFNDYSCRQQPIVIAIIASTPDIFWNLKALSNEIIETRYVLKNDFIQIIMFL